MDKDMERSAGAQTDDHVFNKPARSNSMASTDSNASVVSLTRKPRIRARAKTLTGGRPGPIHVPLNQAVGGEDSSFDHSTVGKPPLLDEDRPEDQEVRTPTQAGLDFNPPIRPPKSSRRSVGPAPGLENVFSGEPERGPRPTRAASDSQAEGLKRVSRAWSAGESSKAPHYSWKTPPDSASTQTSFHFPPEGSRTHVRDSLLTQQSSTSSSVFPASTSASHPRSVSTPHSPHLAYRDDNGMPSGNVEFDSDDVSYRLQLLVKNNYFLPPAHSKPLPSDLTPNPLKARKKSTQTPGFLDIFRVGRSRSKPPSPEPTDHLSPALRTTSDSTTASGHAQRQATPPVRPLKSFNGQDPVARVVVVREKLADLTTAAKQAELKQAELDMRARRENPQGSQVGGHTDDLDAIDPTDAVDLPPPSPGYPFAMQTSALHGLGVQDSIGAADLAEHLPPGSKPRVAVEEAAWRKALLHEAVNLSLHSSNSSMSGSAHISAASVPPSSPTPPLPDASPTQSVKRILGQRILHPMTLEETVFEPSEAQARPSSPARSPNTGRALGMPAEENEGQGPRTSYLPRRAETPSPLQPLAPPPWKQSSPLHSISQNDLHSPQRSHHSPDLRKSLSSPLLTDSYDSDYRTALVMTPPPQGSSRSQHLSFSLPSAVSSSSVDSHQQWGIPSVSSCYSDEQECEGDPPPPRTSMTLSIPTDGRPSMSEYSQPSPQGSAFQDLIVDYPSQSRRSEDKESQPRTSTASAIPRYSTMSPPPRVSSSFTQTALLPPPRSSSLQNSAQYRVMISSPPPPMPASDPGHGWREEDTTQLESAEPPEPPYSLAERRRARFIPASLHIPLGTIDPPIHSAPSPSSPTSFFDQIESNAVDELGSWDDSDGDGTYATAQEADLPPLDAPFPPLPEALANPQPQTVSSNASSKRPFMRLGNHSTPHVARSGMASPVEYTFGDRTISTRSPRSPRFPHFFKRTSNSDHGHGPISHSDEFYRFIQKPPSQSLDVPEVPRRSVSTENNVPAWRHSRKDYDLRKLDGMLIQHMQQEKDTIKRIASSTTSRS